ncbi:chemotaxis protein CheX [Sporomusa acidovorans]|uniref:Chemotaxis phosphatase CheX-like domain-containing protein n=1 Tax=Sporomusa acidovorans (strain ATCC 49682 / DSM 3132 / Mol) TaxID=1123286 RepID=A0ABZ3J6T4_SPOA4|nr:chemotaxis protein CheX [Sporomusa acidovorans]OZC19388.1 CheY-P phosphatase CheX [Sporomusa acidovorans DSM 3132]SDD78427.1 chemotaxis protein CheX [Sporomusa acidovorans]
MKAEYVNPVFKAVTEVFKAMLDLEVSRGAAKTLAGGKPEVEIQIKVTGDVAGSILFQFPQETTLNIVQIMSGMEIKELDGFVTSAMGEISNIISGNAASYLSKLNYHCDIMPPQIEVAARAVSPQFSREALGIPLHTSIGDMNIYISLSEAK